MHTQPRLHRQSGVSLLEMVLVIILLGILSVVSVNMISDSYISTRIINTGNANTSTARYAMERLSREIRQATFDTNTKLILISDASLTQMSFTKSELSVDKPVTIHLNGQALMLSNPASSVDAVLAEHVTEFTLRYFDSEMVESPSMGLIRFVQIHLQIDEPNANPVTLDTLVALRNG